MNQSEPTTLAIHLAPLQSYRDDPNVTEIVINEPGRVFVEDHEGWKIHKHNHITYDWCSDLAKLIGNNSNQKINEESPLLSAKLPDGERIQVVLPPTTPAGTISVTIRRPSNFVMSLDELIESGAFESTVCVQSIRLKEKERQILENSLSHEDTELLKLFRAKQWKSFLINSVLEKKNLITSGMTGSGKTTLSNALIQHIPIEERLISVEDVREARFPLHQNVVNMVYSKDNKGLAKVTPKQIFEANLRQRPDRVLPAELRGDETFFFIQNVLNSGHPGTISTVHANSAKLAFMRLSLMIKSSPEGAGINKEDILETLYALIDVVIQMKKNKKGKRVVTEIYFDPAFAAKQIG